MRWLEWMVALLWLATGASLATRTYFVFNYAAYANLPPHLEAIGVPIGVLPVLLATLAGLYLLGLDGSGSDGQGFIGRSSDPSKRPLLGWRSATSLFAACVPLGISWTQRILWPSPNGLVQVGVWEPIFFAVMTGLAYYWSQRGRFPNTPKWITESLDRGWLAPGLLSIWTISIGLWWFLQSKHLFDSFQLGFNDFGHFLQRVIHTARGQGFLMEAPFLPTFWDHFNPGLVLLVPLWKVWPEPELVFLLQALSLAGSAILLYWIASAQGLSRPCAALWGLAWLVYPSVGQMNVAYTYGWHPISFSIPCLLAGYWFLTRANHKTAVALAILACSFEEGAIAAIGCFAAMRALRPLVSKSLEASDDQLQTKSDLFNNPSKSWALVWLVSTLSFLAVYRWSGLATFQTGRFSSLGSSAIEIILSPILKPGTFFELLFRFRNLAFVAFLLAPFAVLLTRKRFHWTLVATAPLFLVLLLWEHMPAQSLAFQYASVILPILFIGAIESPERCDSTKTALSVLAIGWVLSIFVGQLPWSGDTLVDVKSRSYPPGTQFTRGIGTSDNQAIHRQIREIRSIKEGSLPFEQRRILATGRLASHFLGALELETVGQFLQRYADYHKLAPELSSPLLRYDLILLDPSEGFQQTQDQTRQIREEAIALGFQNAEFQGGFEMLWKPVDQSR